MERKVKVVLAAEYDGIAAAHRMAVAEPPKPIPPVRKAATRYEVPERRSCAGK